MNQDRTKKYKRFKEAFEYLKQTERIVTQKDLADILHKTPETVSRVIAGKGDNPTDKFLLDFARAFSDIFNESYLVSGNGQLLKEQSTIQQEITENNKEPEKEIIRRFLDHISFLEDQIKEKDKEIERLHSIIEKFSPLFGKEEENKKMVNV